MQIIINTTSMIPIYEQIVEIVKSKIVTGELQGGDPLPSVRALSRQLGISALTVKKAYDALEEEGYTATVHGKGSYVKGANPQQLRESQLREVETMLESAVEKARSCALTDDEIRALLELLLGSDM